MMTNEGENIKKSIDAYNKDIDKEQLKIDLSKIIIGGVMSASVIAGLISGYISDDFLRWMILSPAVGGVVAMPAIVTFENAKYNLKEFTKTVKDLKKQLKEEEEKAKTISQTKSKDNTKAKDKKYTYDSSKITDHDMDQMIEVFKEAKNNNHKKH